MLGAKDDQAGYQDQIRAWQQHRERGLRAPDGWLALAGLFWLRPGKSSVGSGETSDFMLPKDAPSQVGQFNVTGNSVTFTSLIGNQLTINGRPFTGTVQLKHDKDDDKSDKLAVGPVQFYVIDRDTRLAIRVKNANSEMLRDFKGTRFFPINPGFRFEAKFIEKPAKVPVPNVLGNADLEESPGLVEFVYEGKTYQMRPIFENKTLFFIFKDSTSKTETYQAGRMVNTPLPKDGKVLLDFNRAYTPPCAFTPYATCPLPLKENVLPFRVEAGELRYGDGREPMATR
jgi:hypothetical protein